jgi:hypothetical protein
MALVYELMEGGSVHQRLFERKGSIPPLTIIERCVRRDHVYTLPVSYTYDMKDATPWSITGLASLSGLHVAWPISTVRLSKGSERATPSTTATSRQDALHRAYICRICCDTQRSWLLIHTDSQHRPDPRPGDSEAAGPRPRQTGAGSRLRHDSRSPHGGGQAGLSFLHGS